jgi:hypothetical protein
VTFPRLRARHPLASYLALAAAPTGNGWEAFALAALITQRACSPGRCAMCGAVICPATARA